MVAGCGNKFVKYSVFFVNFLVFIFGAVILGLALAFKFSSAVKKYFHEILEKGGTDINLDKVNIAVYVLIAIGAFLLLTGFLGCCGAACENSCLLGVFFAIILILFISQLACGIAVLVRRKDIKQTIFDTFTKAFKEYDQHGQELKDALNNMQTELQCCGCNNIGDYPPTIMPPQSCTGHETVGCCHKIWDTVSPVILAIGVVALVVLLVELLAMIFSCILCQAIRTAHYHY